MITMPADQLHLRHRSWSLPEMPAERNQHIVPCSNPLCPRRGPAALRQATQENDAEHFYCCFNIEMDASLPTLSSTSSLYPQSPPSGQPTYPVVTSAPALHTLADAAAVKEAQRRRRNENAMKADAEFIERLERHCERNNMSEDEVWDAMEDWERRRKELGPTCFMQ